MSDLQKAREEAAMDAWRDHLGGPLRCKMRAVLAASDAVVTIEQITEAILDSLQDLETGPLSDGGFSDAEVSRDDHLELREEFDNEIPDVVIDVPQLARDIHAQLFRGEVADDE